MKKLLLAITILVIGLYYINKKTRWITNRVYEIEDVSKKSTILLHKMEIQENVHGVFVHIRGEINGRARVKIYQDSDKEILYRDEEISNRIDLKWGGDWYIDKLKIEYEPLSNITHGSLSLEYAFGGI